MKILNNILILCALAVPASAFSQKDSVSLTLEECLAAALQYNPSIIKADREAEIASLNVKSAESGYYPTLSTSASGGFSSISKKGNDYSTGNWSVTFYENVWQNGKVKFQVEQSAYGSTMVAAYAESVKRNIINDVKLSFYNFYMQYQLSLIAWENVDKARLFLSYAQEKFSLGTGRKTDVLKAESDLKEAEFELESYNNAILQSRNELMMLTGLPFEKFSKPVNAMLSSFITNIPPSADSLYQEALETNPEMISSRNRELMQEARIKSSQATFYPSLNVEGGYSQSYNPILQQQKGWYTGLSLQWTLFNGKERKYDLKSEQVRGEVYSNQTSETENFLRKEINNRILAVRNAQSQIAATEVLIKTTSQNLEIAQEEYRTGIGSMLELTEARNIFSSARRNYEQGVNALLNALANLEQLTGK